MSSGEGHGTPQSHWSTAGRTELFGEDAQINVFLPRQFHALKCFLAVVMANMHLWMDVAIAHSNYISSTG